MNSSAAPLPSDEESIYAVGDIHGCYLLMTDLLGRIVEDMQREGSGRRTTLLFLGDYVDRGPASASVLEGLVWLKRFSPVRAIFLKGNHEQILLDYLMEPVRYQRWLELGGSATLKSYGVSVSDNLQAVDPIKMRDEFLNRLPASHLIFLQQLSLFHESKFFAFAHAGVRLDRPMSRQKAHDLLWIRNGFLEARRPAKKRVVHGHTWIDSMPQILPHRIGIDTGAYETGVLTAARLKGRDVKIISTADH